MKITKDMLLKVESLSKNEPGYNALVEMLTILRDEFQQQLHQYAVTGLYQEEARHAAIRVHGSLLAMDSVLEKIIGRK